MEWMLMPLRRYADFQGRSRRKEYWMFTLGYVIFAMIAALLMFAAGGIGTGATEPGVGFYAIAGIFVIIALGLFIPSLAVQVRRFHDQDLSGWWLLGLYVASIIPFIGFLASIALLVFMCLPGKRGANRFGPDPKENVAEAFA